MEKTIEIKQSSRVHPACLTDAEIAQLVKDAPAQTDLSNIPSFADREFNEMIVRHDAGILTIAITFVIGGVAGGALKEAGKDIYTWVKSNLTKLIKKKRSQVHSSGKYSHKEPQWQLRIETERLSLAGFTAEIVTTGEEEMEDAMKALVAFLDAHASTWDIDHGQYKWFAHQTLKGLDIRSKIDEIPKTEPKKPRRKRR